jgi:hypothetical protein
VQQGVAEKSGLSMDKVLSRLTMMAPLVMGALGKKKKENQMSADQVAADLAAERAEAEKKDDNNLLGSVLGMLGGMSAPTAPEPAASSGGGGLGGILGALGGLFGKKKGS